MNRVSVTMVAGDLLLVSLISFASSYIIPIDKHLITGIRHGSIEHFNEIPSANSNVNAGASTDEKLDTVTENNPEKITVIQNDNSVASSDINSHFIGLQKQGVTNAKAVVSAPLIEVSTSNTVTTTTAPLKAPTTTVPLDDNTPYPLITGSYFTTGAPDVIPVTTTP